MAGRFNTVQPTTRNGYLFGARRENIPWESEGPDTGKRFQRGRISRSDSMPDRMAGEYAISGTRSGELDAPQGVGRNFVPKYKDAWEVEAREDAYSQRNPWQTFDDDLNPPKERW
jgi:hypothetical protein